MYLKRFVYDRLLDWKNEGGHSTLEVGGARQVGKMILSILVDTFISKISLTMQPGPKIDSISGA